MASSLAALVAVLCIVTIGIQGQCPHNQGGLQAWPSAWNAAGANVVIPAGQTYKLSASPGNTLGSISISGTLVIDDADINLDAKWIRVNNEGHLIIGSPDCPITKKVVITFHGARPNSQTNDMGADPLDLGTNLGSKGLAVATGGSISMHGRLATKGWTNLGATANVGATTATLVDNPGWSVGDEIVFANTDFHEALKTVEDSSVNWMRGWPDFPAQTETATITAVNGNSITFTPALTYMHWGAGDEKGEVGLLTRHIVVQGDDLSETDGYGGHFIMRKGPVLQVSGVEFRRMGQKGVKARYPIHFHLLRDVQGLDIYASSNSIHDCFQRCYVIHETHGVECNDNVAYNTFGHCFFLEDGAERKNTISGNLGIDPKPVGDTSNFQIIPSDSSPSVFWITNPDNIITNNVAVGGRFGFWFILPKDATGLAAPIYGVNHIEIRPRWTPILEFANNVAHSAADTGIEIDSFMNDKGEVKGGGFYDPRQGPFDKGNSARDYEWVEPVFTNCVAYKCRSFGIWGQSTMRFTGAKLLDNKVGLMVNGITMIEDSLFVGETDNVGHPHIAEHNRSYPHPWSSDAPEQLLTGHSAYDNGGPQYGRRNHFKNFVSTAERPAGGLCVLFRGPFMLDTRNKYWDLTFENSNKVYIQYGGKDCEYGLNWMDVDGTLTGNKVPTWIVSDRNPPMLFDTCTRRPDWNAWTCPPSIQGYAQITLRGRDLPSDNQYRNWANARWARTEYYKPSKPSEIYGGSGWDSGSTWQDMTNVQTHEIIALRFVQSAYDSNDHSPKSLSIMMHSAFPGDWIVFALPYKTGTTFNMVQTRYTGDPNAETFTAVSKFSDLVPYTYYYDASSQHVYFLFVNTRTGYYTRYGLADYESYGDTITFTATCPGGTCNAPGTTAKSFPADSWLNNDRFQADLKPCQASTNSDGEGAAFFELDVDKRQLTYRIHHGLTESATTAMFGVGAVGETDYMIDSLTLPSPPTSPVAGIITLSHDMWVALAEGNMFVVVATADHPTGAIRGQIGCSGTCSAPPDKPDISSPCDVPSVQDIYTDTGDPLFNPLPDCWDCPVERTFDKPGVCGTSITMSSSSRWHRLVFRPKWTPELTGRAKINAGQVRFLEAFVRLSEGEGRTEDFWVNVETDETGEQWASMRENPDFVENFIVDDTRWTRIRIPMTFFTWPTTGEVTLKYVQFSIAPADGQSREWSIDHMRFLGSTTDQMVSFTAAVPYDPEICGAATDPPQQPQLAVGPTLECVEQVQGGYRAHFGYNSLETDDILVAIGDDNAFSPAPENRGQPTSFKPGRTQYWPFSEFTVNWDGAESLGYTLGRWTVTANAAPTCPDSVTVNARVSDEEPQSVVTDPGYKRSIEMAPVLAGYDHTLDKTSNLVPSDQHFVVYYSVGTDAIKIGVVCETNTESDYCAFGFSPSGNMVGSNVIVGAYDSTSSEVKVEQMFLGQKASPNQDKCERGQTNAMCPDSIKPQCCNHAQKVSGSRDGNFLIWEAIVPITDSDECDSAIKTTEPQNIVYAIGTPSSGEFPMSLAFHHHWTKTRPDSVTFTPVPANTIAAPTCTLNPPYDDATPTPASTGPTFQERLALLKTYIATTTSISESRVSVSQSKKRSVEAEYDIVVSITHADGETSSGDAFKQWIEFTNDQTSVNQIYSATYLQWKSFDLQPTGVEQETSVSARGANSSAIHNTIVVGIMVICLVLALF